MGSVEINSSPIRLVEKLRQDIKTGKTDCQNEALALFKKIFTAIDNHTDTPNVNKGLDDLTQEVSGLEAKVLALTKERDNLLQTVEHMKEEMQQLAANMLTMQHLQQMQPIQTQTQEVNNSISIQEFGSLNGGKDDTRKKQSYPFEIPQQPVQKPISDHYTTDTYDFNQEPEVEIKEDLHASTDEQTIGTLPEKDHSKGEYGMDNRDDGNIVSRGVNLELQTTTTTNTEGGKQINCNQCSYTTTTRNSGHMREHIAAVHMKIKKHRCQECEFASPRRAGIERHWDAIHNKGDKRFKCGSCPFSHPERKHMIKHIAKVHKMDGRGTDVAEEDMYTDRYEMIRQNARVVVS